MLNLNVKYISIYAIQVSYHEHYTIIISTISFHHFSYSYMSRVIIKQKMGGILPSYHSLRYVTITANYNTTRISTIIGIHFWKHDCMQNEHIQKCKPFSSQLYNHFISFFYFYLFIPFRISLPI